MLFTCRTAAFPSSAPREAFFHFIFKRSRAPPFPFFSMCPTGSDRDLSSFVQSSFSVFTTVISSHHVLLCQIEHSELQIIS